MSLHSRVVRICLTLAVVFLCLFGFWACASDSGASATTPALRQLSMASGPNVAISWSRPGALGRVAPQAEPKAAPRAAFQAVPIADSATGAADSTSAASQKAASPATGAPEATSAATAAAPANPSESVAEHCLKCHGPFEKLAARTKDYVTEWDEKANPHVYVPHDSKTVVNCTECHEAHPIPYTDAAKAQAKKPTVQYCYSCHHAETLVSCSNCHKE